MKKVTLILTILCLTTAITACAQQLSKTTDTGIIINGVRWASRNVDAPGTFADKPKDAGMFYQWNRNEAWPATGVYSNTEYYDIKYEEWEKKNDPSPAGWRVPTIKEFERLWDTEKVTHKWTKIKGVKGQKFTDKATGNSIFLPALGYRDVNGNYTTVHWKGLAGFYWSSTPRENHGEKDGVQYLHFDDYSAAHSQGYGRNMFSVRCVAE